MSETPTAGDERQRLAQVHELLKDARRVWRADPTLYRAFSHAAGAIEDRLGLQRTGVNRAERRKREQA